MHLPVSGFHFRFQPGRDSKVPELTHASISRFDHRGTEVPGNGLRISTSHPPCLFRHGCFRRLSCSPTFPGCPRKCRLPRISPGRLTLSRDVLTPSVVARVRRLTRLPRAGLGTCFRFCLGCLESPQVPCPCRPICLGRIGSNQGWQPPEAPVAAAPAPLRACGYGL